MSMHMNMRMTLHMSMHESMHTKAHACRAAYPLSLTLHGVHKLRLARLLADFMGDEDWLANEYFQEQAAHSPHVRGKPHQVHFSFAKQIDALRAQIAHMALHLPASCSHLLVSYNRTMTKLE